jgi:Flp pilus assembly protein TadG
MKINRKNQKGSQIIEFTIAGIPMIFLLFSTLQLSIGVWNYFTLDHAVNLATRYAAVHGASCVANGNACSVTIGDIATQLTTNAVGVPSSKYDVTFKTNSGVSTSCAPVSTCLSNATTWPPAASNDNAVGASITISAKYTFHTAIGMFWFRDGTSLFGPIYFPATSTQQIMY